MDKLLNVALIIAPILLAAALGILAKKKSMLTAEAVQGLQQFAIQFCLPCLLFNSCLTAKVGAESLGTMLLTAPFMVASVLLAFRDRKNRYPYHNFPQLFSSQETGMLGIPLFMILFGSTEAYRMGILDIAQTVSAIPTIAILSANAGENPTPREILKKVLSAPLLIMSLLGLALNLTGIGQWMDEIGIGAIITESTGFLSQPISAMMIFSVGYNFSLAGGSRKTIFRICVRHFVQFLLIGLVIQLGLFLIPNVDPLTRWAVLIFSTLPASYLAPSLGRTEEDFTVASGVCSVLTVVSLMIFCAVAAIVA